MRREILAALLFGLGFNVRTSFKNFVLKFYCTARIYGPIIATAGAIAAPILFTSVTP